jgi:hypothetical protein
VKMVQRPTLLLLHGGPGLDHATCKLGMHLSCGSSSRPDVPPWHRAVGGRSVELVAPRA